MEINLTHQAVNNQPEKKGAIPFYLPMQGTMLIINMTNDESFSEKLFMWGVT